MKSSKLQLPVAIVAGIPCIILLICAIVIWQSWVSDNLVLKQQALVVTAGLSSSSTRIQAINHWVFHNEGNGKNGRFFLIPELGPTPLQVMERGGDCADKSRLVSAMLRELGISSSLIMIFPCNSCAAIHTVVEANYEYGRMVVDPIWNIDYPAGDGKFFGVRQLAGTRRGRDHIKHLKRQSLTDAKIQHMPMSEATFDFAQSINWHKNEATKLVAYGLNSLGYNTNDLYRPYLLEDPKLAITIALAMASAVLAGLAIPIIKFSAKRAA